ncbi:BamA/TamA family outer membrane protein [Paraflavisolibacter sp. H34]|uniref:BamA/TamA family outer membrane protein n=1 Tax=Huijunlia imazamoxiresistens TaxID=3127457 RepID=UPI003019AFAD
MKRELLLLVSFFLSIVTLAQTDSINQRIFLIGDAGELVGETHPVVDWLKKNVDWNDEKNTALFLGDNIYPLGLPMEGDPTYPQAKKILDYQMSLVKGKKARAFFIPGNHDWRNGKMGGWQQAMNQQNYINSQELPNVQAYPLNGCPGPVEVVLSDKVVTVLIDSEWFLYIHDKPGPGSDCQSKTLDEFITELREILASHPDHLMVIAMHHPLRSYGVHGGDYSWKSYIFPFTDRYPNLYFPLPVLGAVYPIARGYFGNLQDVRHPLYRTMAGAIEEAMKTHRNPIHVAGHDHSLQLLMKDSIPYIVAGSGSNISRARVKRYTRFADVSFGFSVIEVWNSGKVQTKFYNIQSADMSKPTFVQDLKPITPDSTHLSPATIDTLAPLPEYVVARANPSLKGSGFKHFFMGKNYRREWTQEVKVPVLDLGKEQGGLEPKRQGGGKQTKSLRLVDSTGKEWVLRSIEKFPEAAIPPDLRQTFARDIVEDGISASYPFASLSMPPIDKAAQVPYLRRKLVYIPDDPRLDRFRKGFKNTMAILEEREPDHIKKTYNTDELVLRLAKDNDDHIDQKAVLRARLVDNFVMDLDRHEDQWRWATRDTGKGKLYFPIPRDHDQAFYVNQGLIPHLAKKPWYVPELQGFEAEADNIKTFNRAARNFDRAFMNQLSEADWKVQIDTFLARMTDAVIDSSLRRQPKEIQGYSLPRITRTLKQRRQYFQKEMLKYYKFLSKEVNVVGTNQRELFRVERQEDGQVHVLVNKIDKDGQLSSKVYERLFDPSVTKGINLYGLADDDSFVVAGGTSRITTRLIGGSGKDHFITNSTGGRVKIYDVSFEENRFSGTGRVDKKVTKDPQNNTYNRLFYQYNFLNPGISLEYNVDDGLFAGASLELTRRGFRKEPYAMRQYIKATHAALTKSYHFRYEADYQKVLKNADLTVRGDLKAPINVTNFFGLGNNTVFDKSKPGGIQYYRTRYNTGTFTVALRKQLQSWMRFSFGPAFQYFHLHEEENKNRFVANTALNGLGAADLYRRRMYAGPEVSLEINSKNNAVLPTRGAVVHTYARSLFGLNGSSQNVTQLGMDLSIFMSIVPQTRFVLATRFGWGHNIGHFEFQQAQYLSGPDNLRGYRKQRFAGRTMAFNNTEIRVKLADFNTYLFPGAIGLLAFHDVGRVWNRGESSHRWHTGYGGGLWLAPIRRFVVTASLMASKEERGMPLVTFGFQF